MAHPSRSLRGRVGGGDRAVAAGRPSRQAQGNDNYRVPFGKLRRKSAIPAASAPPSSAPCNGDCRPFDKLRRRALRGPDREVYFPQEHPHGREAQTDFSHGSSLGVTIAGRPFPHLLFQLILSHSGWRYAEVATGEAFLALRQGLQAALWTLGGVPQVVRSDNTSAATHEMRRSRGRALNDAYQALLDHYGLRSTRINCGQSHENGVAEQGHYRLKDAIGQALILRGSRDFHTADDYALFVERMVQRRNRLAQGKLEQELACLRPLPPAPMPEYVNYRARVRKWSAIQPFDKLRSRPHLHRALPAHREGGADPAVRRLGGSVLQGPPGGTHGAGARRAGGQRQLPPRHRLPGAQARGLRPLPLPGTAFPHPAIPPVL